MKEAFKDVKEKLKTFLEHSDHSHFIDSAINNLQKKLTTASPQIPNVIYPLSELKYYANEFALAKGDNIQKYYNYP
ncbi:hypothetical protein [Shewanella surugensis]|uniref:Bacteriocin immunity protein n=1 Tax=Shewanella surugensis TaxID=212020 RepID=A0ABT0L6R8_9GAMM|nr:hypothetical protein [Shewanella surugensis]MCL1123382.1 hypothetical protein [Shewanella surugensis]